MTLQIIGSGFGRTGTRSLKEALETLGLGPCHHMEEVFQNPAQVPFWQAVAQDRPVAFDQVFAGYVSQIDWPGAHVWREAAAAYPDARIIHSVRPEEVWWKSFSTTIGKLMSLYTGLPLPPHVRAMLDAMHEVVGIRTFDGRFLDRDSAIAAYRRRQAEVTAAIEPHRLLVFDVAEGWEPLCRFLEMPIPETPFPHRNGREDFWANLGGEPA